MGEELALEIRRSRWDDHDPGAHRLVGSLHPDRRLDDFVASAEVLDQLAGSREWGPSGPGPRGSGRGPILVADVDALFAVKPRAGR
jgi:hypothetical protein